MPRWSFWTCAAEEPGYIAVIEPDGRRVTAGELLAAANRIVVAFRGMGVGRGDVIAVALRNRVAFLELYMAAMQAGWYLAPINPTAAPREVDHVLTDSGARVFVHEVGVATTVAGATCLTLDELAARTADQPTATPPDRAAGSMLYFTSGTTGVPKAVKRPLVDGPPEAVVNAEVHLEKVAGILPRSGAVHLVASPLHHSASLLWCTDHLHLGHTVVLVDKWTPDGMLALIERHRITGGLVVPTHFHRLLALPEEVRARADVSSLRHIVHTGAPCPVEIKRRMLAWWGPVIYEVYGSAEGGGAKVTPEEWLARPGTVGRGNGRVRVLRDDGTAAAPREPGLVYVKLGPQPFVYHNDPDKTAAARAGEFFTVGDLGYLDEDDYLFLVGRRSDLILSGGVNIYPAEIESVLVTHGKVGDAAVFGIPDVEWGERVKAVVEPSPGVEPSPALAEELLAWCRSQLAAFKCPRSIDFVAALPREANGKLYKRALRDPYWAGIER